MHDSTNCPTCCQGATASGSMSDAEFNSFLESCRFERAQKQSRFEARIYGCSKWSYSMESATISFGDQVFGVTAIGTYCSERKTWLWGWANDTFSSAVRERSRMLQDIFKLTGFKVFVNPGIPGTQSDALDLTAMAVHQLDALGYFQSTIDGLTLYLAVHEL